MAATITNGRLNVVGLINEAKEAIRNLNLFRSIPPVQDALKLRKQIFSTRLFLLLFIISLITFTIYTSQVTIIRRVTVQNPSYSSYKQLFAQYSHTLSCPCTTISIPQKKFLQLNASYHTVCSSKFVQQQWMNLLSRSQTTSIASFEFRYTGASFFQMLASFCLLSKQLIDDELLTFADTPFITADVMPADRLMEQSQASISLLISNMETGFMRLLSLVDLSTNTDGLVSGLFTNVNYRILPFDSYWSQVAPTPHTFEETNCTCFRGKYMHHVSLHYSRWLVIYVEVYRLHVFQTESCTSSGTILEFIPGLYIGCYNIDGMLQSSLEFLFDQNKIDRVLQLLLGTNLLNGLYPALDRTTLQRFTVNTTGSELISHLFVETWTNSTSHEHYFLSCQPVVCQYSIESKNSLIVIITIVLGIIGGFNIILRLLAPSIIYIIFRIKDKFSHSNGNSDAVENEVRLSLRTRIRNALITIKNFIIHYNMFPSYAPIVHENEIRIQRISTLLVLVLMCICFLILTINTALQKVTTTITIDQPNYTTYQTLSVKYALTLSCLCSTISIEQDTFIDIEPIFHPICSSSFVSSEFLNYMKIDLTVSVSIAYNPFQFISSMCRLSNASINDSLTVFKEARFISREVLASDLFNKQIRDMTDNYIQTMINSFILSFSFIRRTTTGNKLLNGFALNALILVPTNSQNSATHYITTLYSNLCDCLFESCTDPVGIVLPGRVHFSIPGFYTGCYVVDNILKSNLQCFYDENCTSLFLSVYEAPMKFNLSVLDPSTTRFSIFTSIDDLFQDLFVENWTTSISHVDYYNQCKPSSCFYTISVKNNLATILTITIGFLGGIHIVLRFIIPKIIRLLFRCCFIKCNANINRETDDLAPENPISLTWSNVKKMLSNYNLFPTFPPTENASIYRNQIIATRLFIVVFTMALISIAIFNLSVPILTTIPVHSPTYKEYLGFYNQYEQNLECSCTSIAVPYSNFMEINYSFHQICSSVYVGSIWPHIIHAANQFSLEKYPMDFRTVGASIFQIIASFCQLANNTIYNELMAFKSQQLISNNIIQESIFSEQTNASFNLFVQSMESDFQRISGFLRNITITNVLASLTTSNLLLSKISDNNNSGYIISTYTNYLDESSITGLCDCRPPSTCSHQAVVLNSLLQIGYNVSGMVVACFPVQAALKSTLICFFSQTCIDGLRLALNETSYVFYDLDTTALDGSLPSRYSSETKIEEMFNHLMIEHITWNASHEKYYETCRPSKCFYTIQRRNNLVYVLTLVLGLIGGLSSVLQVIIPCVVKMISKFFNRFCLCNRHQAEVHPT